MTNPLTKDATLEDIMAVLESHACPANRDGMGRYGIDVSNAYGLPMPKVRQIGKQVKVDHARALALWQTGNREARLLATLTADPAQLTKKQRHDWLRDLASWDVCDGLCINLLWRCDDAFALAPKLSTRRAEFVKRAGFALMAVLAVKDKKAADDAYRPFFGCIDAQADDDRKLVRKAVNWALRQIGKRNRNLQAEALVLARGLAASDHRTRRWIGRDAARELAARTLKR